MTKQIRVSDLDIYRTDFTKTGFIFDGITDWVSGSKSKDGYRARVGRDGSFGKHRLYYADKVVTISGSGVFGSPAEADAGKDRLNSIKTEGKTILVVVTDDRGATQRKMQVDSIDIPDNHGSHMFRWSMNLIARDPNRYSAPVTKVGRPPVQGVGLFIPLGSEITEDTVRNIVLNPLGIDKATEDVITPEGFRKTPAGWSSTSDSRIYITTGRFGVSDETTTVEWTDGSDLPYPDTFYPDTMYPA
jgi:hypothetical protein